MSARRWRKSYEGQGLVEYSLILLLIVLAVFSALALLGPPIATIFNNAAGGIPGS